MVYNKINDPSPLLCCVIYGCPLTTFLLRRLFRKKNPELEASIDPPQASKTYQWIKKVSIHKPKEIIKKFISKFLIKIQTKVQLISNYLVNCQNENHRNIWQNFFFFSHFLPRILREIFLGWIRKVFKIYLSFRLGKDVKELKSKTLKIWNKTKKGVEPSLKEIEFVWVFFLLLFTFSYHYALTITSEFIFSSFIIFFIKMNICKKSNNLINGYLLKNYCFRVKNAAVLINGKKGTAGYVGWNFLS